MLNACHNHLHHQQQTNTSHLLNGTDMLSCSLPPTTISKYPNLSSSTPTPMSISLSSNPIDINPYEFWSNASQMPTSQQQLSSSLASSNGGGNLNMQDSVVDTIDGYSSISHHLLLPSRSNSSTIKRHKMIYHQKFGEFGVLEGQFTEPSGVTVNAQGDIIVADTNNHRIQIFDSIGMVKVLF